METPLSMIPIVEELLERCEKATDQLTRLSRMLNFKAAQGTHHLHGWTELKPFWPQAQMNFFV